MVTIHLITTEDCPGRRCIECRVTDEVLHRVGTYGGVRPPTPSGGRRQHRLVDGCVVKVAHLGCGDAEGRHLDPGRAPLLLIDGGVTLEGDRLNVEAMARAIIDAVYPLGLPELLG